jgi:predicted metal-binding membrane protein
MLVLLVAGLMDTRVMLLVTTVITAERLTPAGGHIARLSGTLALIAGLSMLAR